MNKLLFLLLCISMQAQNTSIKNLIQNINPEGFTGFYLFDSSNNRLLVDFQSDKLFIPASNAKIFTLEKVYSALNDSIPSIDYLQRNDTLFIKPLGDPTFYYSEFSHQNLDRLIQNNPGVVAIDFSFSDASYAPGWSMDDFDQSYMPERSKLPIFGNLSNSIFAPLIEFDSLSSQQNLHENIFTNNGEYGIPYIVSDSLLIDILELIYHRENFISHKFPYSRNFKTLYSNPKSKVLREMMLESDNFLAEQLILMTRTNPNETVGENWDIYFKDKCFPQPRLEDGSGLSRYDLVSPKCVANTLQSIRKIIPDYLSYFPENGVSGTLEKSYLKETKYIYAKTGSMSGVYNLSGYLKTDSGKLLIFSLMNNNFTEKGRNLKPRIEELLLYIKHHY